MATTVGSTLTISEPVGTTTGDVLFTVLDARVSSSMWITPPAGWTLIRRDSSAPGYSLLTQAVYYKVAGSSEPASYTWSLASPAAVAGAVLDFKGLDQSAPIDSHSGAFSPQSRSILAPSVTTATPGDLVVGLFGLAGTKTISPPAGMTEEFAMGGSSGVSAEGSAYVQANAGPTGDRTARTWGRPSSTIGQLVALRTAASA
ncbi:MAG TPA: hypothetical protein VIM23_13385, partial [Gaiellaceae bacterium]